MGHELAEAIESSNFVEIERLASLPNTNLRELINGKPFIYLAAEIGEARSVYILIRHLNQEDLNQGTVNASSLDEEANEQAITNNSTALHAASSLGYHDVVKALLQAGANPNCEDEQGVSPAIFAIFYGEHKCLMSLVEYHAKLLTGRFNPLAVAFNSFNEETSQQRKETYINIIKDLLFWGAAIYQKLPPDFFSGRIPFVYVCFFQTQVEGLGLLRRDIKPEAFGYSFFEEEEITAWERQQLSGSNESIITLPYAQLLSRISELRQLARNDDSIDVAILNNWERTFIESRDYYERMTTPSVSEDEGATELTTYQSFQPTNRFNRRFFTQLQRFNTNLEHHQNPRSLKISRITMTAFVVLFLILFVLTMIFGSRNAWKCFTALANLMSKGDHESQNNGTELCLSLTIGTAVSAIGSITSALVTYFKNRHTQHITSAHQQALRQLSQLLNNFANDHINIQNILAGFPENLRNFPNDTETKTVISQLSYLQTQLNQVELNESDSYQSTPTHSRPQSLTHDDPEQFWPPSNTSGTDGSAQEEADPLLRRGYSESWE